jgi:hypothetical protein
MADGGLQRARSSRVRVPKLGLAAEGSRGALAAGPLSSARSGRSSSRPTPRDPEPDAATTAAAGEAGEAAPPRVRTRPIARVVSPRRSADGPGGGEEEDARDGPLRPRRIVLVVSLLPPVLLGGTQVQP